MNILISVNSKYLKPSKIMLKSLSMNTSENLNVYLLYNSITEVEISDLTDFVRNRCNGELHSIYVDATPFLDKPLKKHFSMETYFRLLAPELLPEELDKVLWLDSDIVVINSIDDFYNQEFSGNVLAAVPDISDGKELVEKVKLRLGLNTSVQYFNAGVLLFNLSGIRAEACRFDSLKVLNQYSDKLTFLDQDILNVTFVESTKIVNNTKYNRQIQHNDKINFQEIQREASIIHYIGNVKPWNSRYINSCKNFYWIVARECGFYFEWVMFLIKNPIVIILERMYKIRLIKQ